MNNRKNQAVIIFADLSFLVISALVAGYHFVHFDQKISAREDENVLMEKRIEFTGLDAEGSCGHAGADNPVEIEIPGDGGRFIIDGRSTEKSNLRKELENMKGAKLNLLIDRKAPSEDTLYLFSLLQKLNCDITLLHFPEDRL